MFGSIDSTVFQLTFCFAFYLFDNQTLIEFAFY